MHSLVRFRIMACTVLTWLLFVLPGAIVAEETSAGARLGMVRFRGEWMTPGQVNALQAQGKAIVRNPITMHVWYALRGNSPVAISKEQWKKLINSSAGSPAWRRMMLGRTDDQFNGIAAQDFGDAASPFFYTFGNNSANIRDRALTSDDFFAGNFVGAPAGTTDGFDKLAVYGSVGTSIAGPWRWLVDTDNNGVPNTNQAASANINGLPVAGNFDDNTGTTGGGFSYDKVFLIEGVDDTFGSSNPIFIEDAIADTQVLTSRISAENGRFTGGVINVITKSGGNFFSGSFRINLANDDWVDRDRIGPSAEDVPLNPPPDTFSGLKGNQAVEDQAFGKLTWSITDSDVLSGTFLTDPFDVQNSFESNVGNDGISTGEETGTEFGPGEFQPPPGSTIIRDEYGDILKVTDEQGRTLFERDPETGATIRVTYHPSPPPGTPPGAGPNIVSVFNDEWSFNIDVRYDENQGVDTSGVLVIDDRKISPRVGVSYDVKGDGDLVINASYGTYLAALYLKGALGPPRVLSTNMGGPPLNPNLIDKNFEIDDTDDTSDLCLYSLNHQPIEYTSNGTQIAKIGERSLLARAGYSTPNTTSAIESGEPGGSSRPTIVAVIDTGVDLSHPELWGQLWRNRGEIPFNRIDDDGNGYVDDVYGYNTSNDNSVIWDDNGHGTAVAGIIAARADGRGIAGISPQCRLMTVKAFDKHGRSDTVRMAKAIRYAVLNGADIIHVSASGENPVELDRKVFAWAIEQGVLVVASSDGSGRDTENLSPSGLPGVLTVGAITKDDHRAKFSGWGRHVDLVAPGIDIFSLRAHGTDFMFTMAGETLDIKEGDRLFDERWYRADGTSFAAPLVTGVAATLWANNPELTAEQIKNMLIMSCDDVEQPGWDILTGAGRLNAAKALEADPDQFLQTSIYKTSFVRRNGQPGLDVSGRAFGTHFTQRRLQVAYGENPQEQDWTTVAVSEQPVTDGSIGFVPGYLINRSGTWQVRCVVEDSKGADRESRRRVNLR